MKSFAVALVAGLATSLFQEAEASWTTGPSHQEEERSIRIAAEVVRSEHGGLADVLRDTKFTLKKPNQSYLFMDTSTVFEEQSTEKL